MSMDRNLVEGKIDIIHRNLEFLNDYKYMDEEEFINSFKDVQAVKYSLLESIEACIDIASHIISAGNLERPESYVEMFEGLAKIEVIDRKLGEKLADMARFRNILVHGYAKVDNLKVLELVKEDLEDIEDFIGQILQSL
ncbi:MAG: type VII toxin-antitoxin system HepT family RNase toxin [Archaeoglobaceae archaeon]